MSKWSTKAVWRRIIRSSATLAILVAVPALGGVVDTSPLADTLHWRTATADHRTVVWFWPETAHSAKLSVKGLLSSCTRVFTPGTDEWPLSEFVRSTTQEDVLALKLEFFASADASGEALAGETLSADGIGIVHAATSCVRVVEFNSEPWGRAYTAAAVFAVAADTLSVWRDGQDRLPFSAPGWCGSLVKGWGSTSLESISREGSVSTLLSYAGGILMLIR